MQFCFSWYVLFIMSMNYTGRVGYIMRGAVQTENVEPLGQKSRKTAFLSFTVFFYICHGVHYLLLNAAFPNLWDIHKAYADFTGTWALSCDLALRECMSASNPPCPMFWTPSGVAIVYMMGKGRPREPGSQGCKALEHLPLSHWTSRIKYKFKDKTGGNFNTEP